ncbi:hypothetical protein PR202_gb09175 [Eleusine coracana subsp. coracana]|uniref:Uncharacterized protein n=1 Tax=Eleusine coracana subsp. coracana TaxID=191504 RepID=A0AAV5EGW3_ELECO|nr:hypothetical protein PR202_gb09175 [Eleusine coracana subsp. coracana]
MGRGENRPAGGDSVSAAGATPSSGSPSSSAIEALATDYDFGQLEHALAYIPLIYVLNTEAMAFDGGKNEESIDIKVQKALECPLVGLALQGSDCVNPFIAFQHCIKENKEAFIKEILEEEENDDEADKSNIKVLPPVWSREPKSKK